jgi:hypothetical protein
METPTLTILNGDLFATRDAARAAAAYLRRQGYDAHVEQSGPRGAREWRVTTRHPTMPDVVAYFAEGDRLDAYAPHWI